MALKRKPPKAPQPPPLIVAWRDGVGTVLAGPVSGPLDPPLPAPTGLWVAAWDPEYSLYAWRPATSWDLWTNGLLEAITPPELEARNHYLEARVASLEALQHVES
jgi:hypothetical protein